MSNVYPTVRLFAAIVFLFLALSCSVDGERHPSSESPRIEVVLNVGVQAEPFCKWDTYFLKLINYTDFTRAYLSSHTTGTLSHTWDVRSDLGVKSYAFIGYGYSSGYAEYYTVDIGYLTPNKERITVNATSNGTIWSSSVSVEYR
jgi:hypothetical protein